MKISVIGAGSFGTALSLVLLENGHDVTLYGRNPVQIEMIRKTGGNHRYLPGLMLPEELKTSSDLNECVADCDLLVMAVPAQQLRQVLKDINSIRKGIPMVNVAKGIEQGTLMRMSEVWEDAYEGSEFACLSGPSHAEEVARRLPSTVCVASKDPEFMLKVQQIFMNEYFRVYTNHDLVGVELGGAVKNVIALACGISDGLELGDNAKAALITRGIAEMKRLGIAMGGEAETFAGLSGIGDLVVTCTSIHSRNRRFGIMLGQGMPTDEALNKVGMIVEGYTTQEAVCILADRYGVDMPISKTMHQLLLGELTPVESVRLLMGRQRKHE
ncbi:MAG: NAD(P)-dependent glycerol-3-phosphate dehydrogenase [Firmicutes bacterium]|nr:NAD(P)-dependent glycerol-3-phosphate dehydrogenase [Bacillota bacterium]